MNLQALSAPFPPEAIHWRAQALTRDKSKAMALAYLDSRDVQDRLDAVCTPLGWEDSYIETARGRVICTLSIKNEEGAWVSKSDGAGDTAVEGEKGGISDAFKRAAVKWGIGRYLYELSSLGPIWAPCETYNDKWSAWKPEAYDLFAKALAKVGRPTGPLNDRTREWVEAQIQSVGKEPHDLLRALSPASLKDLTYEQLPDIQGFINANKKAA